MARHNLELLCGHVGSALGQFRPRFQRDLATLDALRPRLLRLARLHQRGADTEMAVGSDLMTNALEGYAVFKVAGQGQGMDEARKAMSARFARGPRKPAVPGDAASGGAAPN